MRIICIALFVLLGGGLISATQAAGPSAAKVVADAESGDGNVRNQTILYVSGVLAGIFGVEGLHALEGKPQVFCVPRDLVITPSDLIQLAKAQVQALPAMGVFSFELVAIKGLQTKYPCK